MSTKENTTETTEKQTTDKSCKPFYKKRWFKIVAGIATVAVGAYAGKKCYDIYEADKVNVEGYIASTTTVNAVDLF